MLTIFQMVASTFGLIIFLPLALFAIVLAFLVFAGLYGLACSIIDIFKNHEL